MPGAFDWQGHVVAIEVNQKWLKYVFFIAILHNDNCY